MKKVLLCEDEDVMITAIEFRLQKIGCQAIKARSFDAAVQTLQLSQPDLIIISLTLPDQSGQRLLDWVRKDYAKPVPVIIISSLEQEEEVLLAYTAGADDFITKPFKPTELILRVIHLLDKYSV
jgi:DNA-binding response OmpR family regulator